MKYENRQYNRSIIKPIIISLYQPLFMNRSHIWFIQIKVHIVIIYYLFLTYMSYKFFCN